MSMNSDPMVKMVIIYLMEPIILPVDHSNTLLVKELTMAKWYTYFLQKLPTDTMVHHIMKSSMFNRYTWEDNVVPTE